MTSFIERQRQRLLATYGRVESSVLQKSENSDLFSENGYVEKPIDDFSQLVSKLFNTQILLEHCHRKTTNEPKHEALGEAYTAFADLKDKIIEQLTGGLGRQYNKIESIVIDGYTPDMCNVAAIEVCNTAKLLQMFSRQSDLPSVENLAQELFGIGTTLKYKLSLNTDANENTDNELDEVLDVEKGEGDELEKGGKHGMIGEIREHNGKKFKKVAEGKWMEVSEHGLTKKEHLYQYGGHLKSAEERGVSDEDHKKHLREASKHDTAGEKLSDKEHTDEEVGLGGSKVIGHTKSGKPIYEGIGGFHFAYKGWTDKDHEDASKIHSKLGNSKISQEHKDMSEQLHDSEEDKKEPEYTDIEVGSGKNIPKHLEKYIDKSKLESFNKRLQSLHKEREDADYNDKAPKDSHYTKLNKLHDDISKELTRNGYKHSIDTSSDLSINFTKEK